MKLLRVFMVLLAVLAVAVQILVVREILSTRQSREWGPIAGSFDRCKEYWKLKKRGGREYLHVYPGGFREMRKDILLDPPPTATPLFDRWQTEPELQTPLVVEL